MNKNRNAAQSIYDAFKKDPAVSVEETYEDLTIFRKGKLYYVGDDKNYFVGGFPENLAREYFEDRKINRLVEIAQENPELLEDMILADAMESANEEYHTSAFTARYVV